MIFFRQLRWLVTLLFAGCLCAGLGACGQKGALILPPTDTTPKPVTPQTFPEPETEEPESERAPLGILPGSLPTLP
ncbi:LPS translocon maturation chaperone LptM [Oxalobacter paeniformigenes]|uniref:LPS translocon maturation chaperone LptM n=1 Tax=Oxalobacter paeniformigenes TaxID=2946594 RepID=UPI0038B2774F